MRRNKFGEAYCSTAAEVLGELERRDRDVTDVHVDRIDEPEGDHEQFTAEVLENESGDLVCYIEMRTAHEVRLIIGETGIELLS